MAQANLYNNEISSFTHQNSTEFLNSIPPISDYSMSTNLAQDQLHLVPTWQELEKNLEWHSSKKKLDFTFNNKDLANAQKLEKLIKERKVYHQPYDICPVRRRKPSGVNYSKSCEPRRGSPRDEYSQTDFDPSYLGLTHLKSPGYENPGHIRRSSSLSHKNPDLNLQSDFYGTDPYPHNFSIRNSYISSGRKDHILNSPSDYQNLTIPSARNEPDSLSKDMKSSSRIDHSNFLSTRDSVGFQSRFAKEKTDMRNYDKKQENDSFEFSEDQPLSRRISPKILIIDAAGAHNAHIHGDIRNHQRNSKRDIESNFDYHPNSERSGRRESNEYRNYEEKDAIVLSDEEQSDEDQSSDDLQLKNDKKAKKDNKGETKKKTSEKVKNSAKFKFIGDSKANKGHEIPSIYKEEDLESKPYSNRNIIDIKKLLAPQLRDAIFSNPDIVVLEGELTKYKPGMHFNYVKRWVQITKNELRYYESRLRANAWESTPILIIPFKDIKAVYRVNIKLPKNIKQEGSSKGIQKIQPKLYHFEVFTNNHPLPSVEELDASVHTNGSVLHDKSLFFSPEHTFGEKQNKSRFAAAKDPRTGYRENTHLMPPPPSKKREEQNAGFSAIPENCDYEEYSSNILSGSLMNSKIGLISSKDRAGPPSSFFKNQHNQSIASSVYRPGAVQKNPTKASQISEDKDKSTLTNKDSKTMYHYVKTIEDLASWSGRHKEWYHSEKRLLFCSISYKEREIWLSVINWLIKVSTGEA